MMDNFEPFYEEVQHHDDISNDLLIGIVLIGIVGVWRPQGRMKLSVPR